MINSKRQTYQFGPFRLSLAEHRLWRTGEVVSLTPKVFDLLCALVQNAGHLLEKEELLKTVWPDSFVEEANLNRAISVLRKALGNGSDGAHYIETVPKRGYRFTASVAEIFEGTAPPPVLPVAVEAQVVPKGGKFVPGGVGFGLMASVLALLALFLGLNRDSASDAPPEVIRPLHHKITFSGKDSAPAISPDGKRIAYIAHGTRERKVMVNERTGGTPFAVFGAPELGRLRWSPDGAELMFWARGDSKDGLYVVPYSGGTARKLASAPAVASWSPDGSTIALARYMTGGIAFLNQSGQLQRLIPLEGVRRWVWDLDWSPDNGELLFVSDDYQGRRAISTIREDGSSQRKLLEGPSEISAARWAPGGSAIYYLSGEGETASLYNASLAALLERKTFVPAPVLTGLENDGDFGLSADGKYLTYARAPFHSNLWRVQLRDSGEHPGIETRELTHGTSIIERPSISPDGKRIVFNMGSPSVSNLYTMPIDGGTPTQLTFLNSLSLGGVWSPDGSEVAFASKEDGVPRVWVVSAEGGPPRPISSGEFSDSYTLTWSPASEILYQKAGNQNFYRLDPKTRAERLLLESNLGGWVFNPVHAPDLKRIAVAWSRRRTPEAQMLTPGVWILDSNKPDATLLTGPEMHNLISWSTDGKLLYAIGGKRAANRGLFATTGETITEVTIQTISLGSGVTRILASLPFEEVGGVSISPDGKTLVCAVYSSLSDIWVIEDFDPHALSVSNGVK